MKKKHDVKLSGDRWKNQENSRCSKINQNLPYYSMVIGELQTVYKI